MKPIEDLLEIAKCAKDRAEKVNYFRYSHCSHEDSYTRSSNDETKRPVTYCRDCDSCFTHHLPTDIPEISDAVIDLITQLKDAQAEIKNLKTFNTEFTRVDKRSWGDLFNEITQLKQDIEKLKKRISWLESGFVHTCHAECEKPLCVANREIERLRAIVLKIETQDSMSVDDMYFISGADKKITTLEAQVKELSGLRVCPACGEKYSDEPSSHPSYGALEVTIKALQLEIEQLKTGLGVAGEFIKRNDLLQLENENLKKELKQVQTIGVEMQREVNRKLSVKYDNLKQALDVAKEAMIKMRGYGYGGQFPIDEALQKIKTLTEGK